jgi:hypothetical protein
MNYLNSSKIAKIIVSRGGLFDGNFNDSELMKYLYSLIEIRFGNLTNRINNEMYDGKLPAKLDWAFINNDSLNAFATSDLVEGVRSDFIGLNIGVVYTLFVMYTRVMANPDNLRNIGNPDMENHSEDDKFLLTTNVIFHDIKPIIAKCNTRLYYAIELTLTSLEFLFLHEMVHLRNGHVDYLKSLYPEAVFAEAYSKETHHKLSPLISQALEMDADSIASVQLFRARLIESYHLKSRLPNLEPFITDVFNATCRDELTIVWNCAFSVYFMFSLFDQPEWTLENQILLSHPTAPFRANAFSNVLWNAFENPELFEGTLGIPAMDVMKACKEATLIAEDICQRIAGRTEPSPQVQFFSNLKEAGKYFDLLEEAWTSVRPFLLPFVRGVGLAPGLSDTTNPPLTE